MFKKLWPALILALGVTGFQAAHAHGAAEPKHGGVVQVANDLAFELVAQPDGALLYIEDHGKAVPVAGVAGKLIVLNGSSKAEAELKPAGDKLEAKGVKVASGSKVIGSVNTGDNKTITVRFSVK
jgi:hypothetical protein